MNSMLSNLLWVTDHGCTYSDWPSPVKQVRDDIPTIHYYFIVDLCHKFRDSQSWHIVRSHRSSHIKLLIKMYAIFNCNKQYTCIPLKSAFKIVNIRLKHACSQPAPFATSVRGCVWPLTSYPQETEFIFISSYSTIEYDIN